MGTTDDTAAGNQRPIVVVGWEPDSIGLVRALARLREGSDAPPPVVCIGSRPAAEVDEAIRTHPERTLMRYVASPNSRDPVATLTEVLRAVDVVNARSVIVLPQPGFGEPDAHSRMMCSAVNRACDGADPPNVVVEVEDPEAAFEFAGLGVSTVFYPGYLRAALLAHACVDLGVFQFVFGLLRGAYRVSLHALPKSAKRQTFADAAMELETTEDGRPLTVIGAQFGGDAEEVVVINPGPRTPLRGALGLLVLTEHRAAASPASG